MSMQKIKLIASIGLLLGYQAIKSMDKLTSIEPLKPYLPITPLQYIIAGYLEEWKLVQQIYGYSHALSERRVSEDGNTFLYQDDANSLPYRFDNKMESPQIFHLIDDEYQRVLFAKNNHEIKVDCLSRNGKFIVGHTEKCTIIYQLQKDTTYYPIARLENPTTLSTVKAISDDGELLVIKENELITKNEIRIFEKHGKSYKLVYSFVLGDDAISSESFFIALSAASFIPPTISTKHQIVIPHIPEFVICNKSKKTNAYTLTRKKFLENDELPTNIAFSQDGKYMAVSSDKRTKIASIQNNKFHFKYEILGKFPRQVAFSKDSSSISRTAVSALNNCVFEVWHLNAQELGVEKPISKNFQKNWVKFFEQHKDKRDFLAIITIDENIQQIILGYVFR